MDLTRLLVVLGVLSCVLLVTNLVSVVVLLVRTNQQSNQTSTGTEEQQTRIVNVFDFRDSAKRTLSRNAWNYVEQGATTGNTLRDNVAAFSRYRLLPHMLRGVADANTTTTILRHVVSCPIGISPTAFHKWANPAGENATALAARAKNVIATYSAYASIKMEDIAAAAPGGKHWQQIYLFGVREMTLNFVRRAEELGFTGLVVTVDRPMPGVRYASMKGLARRPKEITSPNFPNNTWDFERRLVNPGQDWAELSWLRNQTRLPIIAKGILRGEDAKLAVQAGVDAIMVSNHGGRVLDGVPATIDVLSEVVAAVNGSVEVYMDGGIRTGMDVARAIALGARAVFLGRPVWYGLAHSGQEGVEKILDILQREFLNAMQLLGADRPYKLDPSVVLTPPSCVGEMCHLS